MAVAAGPRVAPVRRSAPRTVADIVTLGVFLAFLLALLQPTIPNPFLLEPGSGWTLLCYAFALPVLIVSWARGVRWQPTPFEYALGAYVLAVLVTWPTSVNRQETGIAIVRIGAQIVVYCAVRMIAAHNRHVASYVVAVIVVGIAALEWTATDFHLRYGLDQRILNFPGLDWNGREGLGVAGAVQFALLIGICQQARSRSVQLAAMLLIVVGVVELLFFYSRVPWVAAVAVLGAALITALRRGGFRRSVLALAVVAALVASVGTTYMAHLAKQVVSVEVGIEGGLALRLAAWRDATLLARRHFFLGVGLGNFIEVRQATGIPRFALVPVLQPIPVHPHNLFLQQLAEVGVVGGVAYLSLWAIALWAGWRISARPACGVDGSLSLFYAVVAIAVANLGENMFLDSVAVERIRLHTIAWIVIALVIAEWNRFRAADAPGLQDVA